VDQSPDPYAPFDIFLQGYVKCYIFRISMDDTEIFLAMVIEAIQSVMKGMLTHT